MIQNRFSPLSDLGNGVEDELVEKEVHEVVQRSNHHDETTLQRSVDFVGEFQTCEESNYLVDLPLEKEFQTCGCEEKDFCVLECDPLSRWEPNDLRELVLVQDSPEGTQVLGLRPPLNWVSQLMKNFCKLVGFPIVKHEAQCLALFRLLEQECLKVIKVRVPSVLQIQDHEV